MILTVYVISCKFVFRDLCDYYISQRMSEDSDPLIWITSKDSLEGAIGMVIIYDYAGSCSHPMKKSHAKKKATSPFTNMQPRNFPLAPLECTGKFYIYVWKQPYNYENWKFLDSGKTLEESRGPIMSCLPRISDNISGRLGISIFMYCSYRNQ